MYPTLESTVGNTPLVRLQRLPGVHVERDSRQARRQQSGRVGEGSRGAVDDHRGRKARRHQARRYVDRGDIRQHGDRTRDGRGDQGLPDDPGDARQPVARAPPVDASLRRRPGADGEIRGDGAGARYGGTHARERRRNHPRPVRESRQSPRALSRSPDPRSGAIPTARSHTSFRRWERLARSWACRDS